MPRGDVVHIQERLRPGKNNIDLGYLVKRTPSSKNVLMRQEHLDAAVLGLSETGKPFIEFDTIKKGSNTADSGLTVWLQPTNDPEPDDFTHRWDKAGPIGSVALDGTEHTAYLVYDED